MSNVTHAPRWPYDCDRCKFDWTCGPKCGCHYGKRTNDDRSDSFNPNHKAPVGMKPTPPARRKERMRLMAEWRKERAG